MMQNHLIQFILSTNYHVRTPNYIEFPLSFIRR